jgi:hypothetical protein
MDTDEHSAAEPQPKGIEPRITPAFSVRKLIFRAFRGFKLIFPKASDCLPVQGHLRKSLSSVVETNL